MNPYKSRFCSLITGSPSWAAGMLVLALAAGCTRGPDAAVPNNPAEPTTPAALETVKLKREAVHPTIAQPGTIAAFEETPIYARIAGYVKEWKVDRGDQVTE